MAAEVGTAVVSGVASEVAESLFDPIRREISYVFKYRSYVEKLRSQLVDLKNKQQRLQYAVNDAERQGDEIYDDVKQWLIKMKEFVERAEKFIDEDDGNAKKKRCFIGLCPDLLTRRNLCKETVNAAEDASNLLANGNFSNVSYRPPPVKTEHKNIGRGYQQFDSRMKVFQDVMEALKDSTVNMIGVYGMGGVGKTTLVKEVAKKVMEEKLFDKVVMAEVTLNPDLKTIQDKIAYDLDLMFGQHESTVYAKADRLHQRLKKERRILVVLDNIWAELKLEDVGIPFGDDEKEGRVRQQEGNRDEMEDDQGRCTILLTSRSQHVLRNDMNSQKNFLIEALSNDEAMSLFRKIVGDHSTESFECESLAVKIVAKCGGLPIAIETIAKALKFKPLPFWKNALYQLENSNPRQIQGMEANVYSSIKLSYHFLQSEEAKSLFRLCALQKDGSRIPINDLMMYGMGLNLFEKVYTLEQGRNQVQVLIDVLKTSCLLLDGDTDDDVKMHDVVHAVAVSIATDELMLNICNVAELKEEPENGIQKDATAISLPYIDIPELIERLECPKLELFLLFVQDRSFFQIPNLFFEGMKQLRVLSLREIHFPSLPSSLDCLNKLRTLSLINCRLLGDVAIVGELKKLEILSFRGSSIEQLPREIGQLTRLKLLDLRNCSPLKVIAPNVISKLSQLEELYVGYRFTRWEKGDGGSNASLIELKALSKLTTLEINIQDVQIKPHDLVSFELQRCKILIGDAPWPWLDYEISRTLKPRELYERIDSEKGKKFLLRRTESLCLVNQNGFQSVHELDHRNGLPPLKHLVINNSFEILYIVNSVGLLWNAFSLLESLFLSKLINLEKVSHGHLQAECLSFSKLRIINVKECHKLKHLFSFSMARNLLRLEEMEVTQCENLKMIVGEESESRIVHQNESVNFTQVHSLTLCGLPQLTSSGVDAGISRSLLVTASASKDIVVKDDLEEFMNVLFNNKVCFSALKKLKLSSLHCIEKLWIDRFPAMSTSSCQNLTKLVVFDCNRLKFLFLYSMVNSLVGLQQLVIGDCKSMEWVIEEETSSTSNSSSVVNVQEEFHMASSRLFQVFPQLTNLELVKLPKLKSIYQGTHILEWSALKYFKIDECHEVEKLFGSSESKLLSRKTENQQPVLLVDHRKVRFRKLEVLEIFEMNNLRKIWEDQFDDLGSFENLKSLDVRGCDKLMTVFPLNLTMRLERLDNLNLIYCPSIEEIIEEESSSSNYMVEEVPSRFQVLPQLTKLKLWKLPKLKSIYQGTHILEWPALKYLGVIGCHEVNSLFGSSKLWSCEKKSQQQMFLVDHHKVAFPNLTTLEVLNCDELRFLATFSTVESLVKLIKIKIFNCKMIEKIIEMQLGEEVEDPIVFSQLEDLSLVRLSRLASFCSKDYTLAFPYLKEVSVRSCPNMKTFSQGVVSTPILQKVEFAFRENDWRWEGNLNSTIQNLFREMVGFRYVYELKLSQVPNLKEIWQDQALPVNYFRDLEWLVVDDCMFMSSAIPAKLLPLLNHLKMLEVRNCDSIEEILHLEELNANSQHLRKLFPKLKNLSLIDLPKLKKFCNFNRNIAQLPKLSSLLIENCPDMVTFIANSITVQPFFNGKVAFPILKKLKLSKLPKLLHLCETNSHPNNVFGSLTTLEISKCYKLEKLVPSCVSLRNLTTMEVSKCDGLINLMTISTAKSLVKLKRMKVTDCKMIEEIIQVEDGSKKDCIVLGQLELLELSRLPSLISFCSGDYELKFLNLNQVMVKECPVMEIFSQGVLITPKLRRLQLIELEDEGRWEGNLNSTIQKLFEEMSSKDKD